MVLLFQKGSKDTSGNYRPLSLARVVEKQLKGILRDKIYLQLDRHIQIRDSQHGIEGRKL